MKHTIIDKNDEKKKKNTWKWLTLFPFGKQIIDSEPENSAPEDNSTGMWDWMMPCITTAGLVLTLLGIGIVGHGMHHTVEPAYGEPWSEFALTQDAEPYDTTLVLGEGDKAVIGDEITKEDAAAAKENNTGDTSNEEKKDITKKGQDTKKKNSSKMEELGNWLVTPWYAKDTSEKKKVTPIVDNTSGSKENSSSDSSGNNNANQEKPSESKPMESKPSSGESVTVKFGIRDNSKNVEYENAVVLGENVYIVPGTKGTITFDALSISETCAGKNFKLEANLAIEGFPNEIKWYFGNDNEELTIVQIKDKVNNMFSGMKFSGKMKSLDFLKNMSISWELPSNCSSYSSDFENLSPNVIFTITATPIENGK